MNEIEKQAMQNEIARREAGQAVVDPKMRQQQQARPSSLVTRTVLANNAIEGLRSFYVDSLGTALEQNSRNEELIRRMGEQINQLRTERQAVMANIEMMIQGIVKATKSLSDGDSTEAASELARILVMHQSKDDA